MNYNSCMCNVLSSRTKTYESFSSLQVSEKYRDTHRKMTAEVVKSYLPFPWVSMAQTKHYFYKGLAHYYVAMALMEQKGEAAH